MNELDAKAQERTWLKRLGMAGLGPTVLTLFAGWLILVGATRPGFSGLGWLMAGGLVGVFAAVWTVVVIILALIALTCPDIVMFSRPPEDISAILFVNLNLVLLWMLATLLVLSMQ